MTRVEYLNNGYFFKKEMRKVIKKKHKEDQELMKKIWSDKDIVIEICEKFGCYNPLKFTSYEISNDKEVVYKSKWMCS
jgi:hypothetical protein